MKKLHIFPTFFVLLSHIFILNIFSQTLEEDFQAVQEIIDCNGVEGVTPEDIITEIENERVVSINLWSPPMSDPFSSIPAPISKLTVLKKLEIFGENIFHIHSEIGSLKSLEYLELSYNSSVFTNPFPEEIYNLSSLEYLSFAHTFLDYLPGGISKLTSLKVLDLTWCKLKDLPTDLGNLQSLEELYLTWNTYIDSIPGIGKLTNLKMLNLSSCRYLGKLQSEIGNLTSLNKLVIFDCRLPIFPAEICNLISLQELNCQCNQFTSIPSAIANLTSLIKFDISDNSLQTLPASIVKFYIPHGPDGLNLCNNSSLVFTEEQKLWVKVKNYPEYEEKYCIEPIQKESIKKNLDNRVIFYISPNKINLSIPHDAFITVEMFDTHGRLMGTIINGFMKSGYYTLNLKNNKYSTGTYYFTLSTGYNSIIRKAVIMK